MRQAGCFRRAATATAVVVTTALALLSASPAVSAAPAAPAPSVIAVHVSAATVSHGGGKVTVTASVRHATSCRFSSRPGVRGLPARVTCAAGQARTTVRLPANAGDEPVSYKLTVTATGPGGTSAPKSATVKVLPAPPAATLTASPDGLIKAGGSVLLTVKVSRSSSCALAVTPPVSGLPATLHCTAGSNPATLAKTLTLPALAGSTASSYIFTLTVSGPGGTTTANATETVWPAMTFSAPAQAASGYVTSVSCPTTAFCAATTSTGVVYFYNGSHWTVPAGNDIGIPLVSVSCTSPTFCMVADGSDSPYGSGTWVWNGKGWTGSLPGIYLTSVSCTSPIFCVAVGNLNPGVYASTWNGISWTSATEIDSPYGASQVSCASTQFCAVVDDSGDALTYDGLSWSAPDPIDPGVISPLATVSCPTATFCTAMDGFGQAFTWTGSSWTGPTGVESDAGVTSVSCTSAAFCVAADVGGNVVTEYAGTWSTPATADPQPVNVFNGFTAISCATVAFCAALDANGNVSFGTG